MEGNRFLEKTFAFLMAFSLALGLYSAAFAEGVNVCRFFSVYKLSVRANSETNEVIEIRVSPEADEHIAFTACMGILMPFQQLSIMTALRTWEEIVLSNGEDFSKVLVGDSFEQKGYVFHMTDDDTFCITEKNCYDCYYNR